MTTQPHWTVNISDTVVPEYVKNIISLGPNFGLPHKREEVPMIKVLSSIESALYNNPYANEIRAKMVNIATNFSNSNKKSDRFLLAYVKKTEIFLKENKQIIVINADKGNKTIIMNRTEYESSMGKLVNDDTTYTEARRDPTNRIEKMVNELISTWCLNNKITDNEEAYLKTHNSVAPAIYGLGKLHKRKLGEDIPMRPIVSTVQSPTYKISKMIANSLSQAMKQSTRHLKDSWQFAERIKTIKIPSGYKLISLDATSLFTNVPINLCIKAIKKRWNIIKPHTRLTQQQYIDTIKMITSESYFRYGDKYYIQKSGLAMGSSISGFLADIVMEDLEETALSKLQFIVPFYERYVDDIIIAIPENATEATQKTFNAYHKQIQFTVEEEAENSINFLDFTLMRKQNGEITTKWYQKAVASGRYLHFKSSSSTTHKRNVNSTDRSSHKFYKP